MRLVVLESPYAGDTDANAIFARSCVADCLSRGESPIASHLLYTQPGVLVDNDPAQRALGIAAGHAWLRRADAAVFYVDLGFSKGMLEGRAAAVRLGTVIEFRSLDGVTWSNWRVALRRDITSFRRAYPEAELIIGGRTRPRDDSIWKEG